MSLLATDAPPADAAPPVDAAPVTQTPPAAFSWADESGKFSPGWTEKLGDEFKDNGTLKTLPDLRTLAKAYLDTKAMVGKKLSPPSDTSTPEEVAKWRELMGAPATPDEYGPLMPEGFQPDMWNGDLEKEFAAVAHKYHLPASAVKEIAALQAKGTLSAYERETARAMEQLETGRAELKKAWGQEFERRATEAKALAAALGIDESDAIFTTRPDLLQKLAAAAPTLLGPDRIVTGETPSISGGIDQRIESIRNGDDYQGKNGFDKQQAAQKQLHQLMQARKPANT